MSGPLGGVNGAGLVDDVIGVEVTIDGMLVIADRLQLVDFPTALGIRLNIPQEDLRQTVWGQVQRDLMAQGVLDAHGQPHPKVAAMVDTLSRPDRVLEGRWWRRDLGGVMVRFVVCRKGDRHVVVARDDEMLVLQLVAPQVSLADMLTVVLGRAEPANVEPLTGIATELANCKTVGQLAGAVSQRPRPASTPRSSTTRIAGWSSSPASAIPAARRRRPMPPPAFWTLGTAGWCRFPVVSAGNCTEASYQAPRKICSAQSIACWSSCQRAHGWITPPIRLFIQTDIPD